MRLARFARFPGFPGFSGVAGFNRLRAAVAVLAVAVVFFAQPASLAQTRNFVWKVSAKQGNGAVYLVGSVHMLTKDYYPLSPALDNAFKDSDLLVEEADIGEMLAPASQFQLLARGMLPQNQSLDTVLTPATYALVASHVAALGVPIEPLKRFKPWFLALTVLGLEWQKAGFDPELGLDKHFYDRAAAEGKKTQGLETIEFQVSRFDEMTMAQQDRLLAESLKDLEHERANVTMLADAWRAGDAANVEKIVLQGLKDDPLVYQRLLVERNRNWLPTIEALFTRPGRAFVVVGAAHLVGPDGLLAALRAKGYRIEQL